MTAVEPGDARILDRGYRRYDGSRLGVRSSAVRLATYSMQRALGIRRPAWAKILPILTVALAYVPAIVFIGIVALIPDDVVGPNDPFRSSAMEAGFVALPTYGEYYGFVIAALVVFVAFVGPELLCPDRRSGMLGLYLASPLSRNSYLVAKAAAIGVVLALVTLGPPLLMLIAFVLQGSGPDGFLGFLGTLGSVVAAGLCLSAFYTSISLAVSSFTDRKAIASAGIILLIFVSGALVGGLVEESGSSESLVAFNLFRIPIELARVIHSEPTTDPGMTTAVWLGWAGWTAFGGLVTWWRYRRLQVTK